MKQYTDDKRKYRRFSSEDKVSLNFSYDLITKMRFYRIKGDHNDSMDLSYPGFVKNVSSEGLCFICDQGLCEGEIIEIEVVIPSLNEKVKMQGEVRWSKQISSLFSTEGEQYYAEHPGTYRSKPKFDIGVLLKTVEGKSVMDSIHFDERYHVMWSIVLESIIGRYRLFINENHDSQHESPDEE